MEILKHRVKCPQCGGWMSKKMGKYGEFYSCANYPECTATIDIKATDKLSYGYVNSEGKSGGSVVGDKCGPAGGRGSVKSSVKRNTGGISYGSVEAGCNSEGSHAGGKSGSAVVKRNAPERNPAGIRCPLCGAPMKKRTGKHGPFYGCSRYPKCKGTIAIRK
ncbi:MAG: hypothetical protein GX562_03135 [Coriobacteriaceae bacterium]|nr:hypothetical protein [Coriobacteriaceae bacterium]